MLIVIIHDGVPVRNIQVIEKKCSLYLDMFMSTLSLSPIER
ncbi:hypothetical protein DERF_006606 [Dermatophagoides farinae]|uniref:Uncharacterized protein n=1 Tax=Dermatophagoides farinae TaxID=6954 RepID=A0A922L2S1_DERFA|nr:hypothetical protein DERF_006606 [Dermatophagoides farinae]